MSSHKFPSTLRPIVNKGYSQSRGGNIWRSNVQGGLPRQGRDTFYDSVPIQVALVVSSLGRQVFYNFLNLIDGGASSFLMNLDSGQGIEEHLVQITSDISDSTQTGTYWAITFTAMAERTAIQDADPEFSAELVELFDQYGDNLTSFLNLYEEYVTTPLFINNLPDAS